MNRLIAALSIGLLLSLSACDGNGSDENEYVANRATFDSSAEGWVASTYPVQGPYAAPVATPALTHQSTGGNPEGYIEIEDPDNNVVFWRAPASFLGDRSGAYGQNLSFDLYNSGPVDYTDDFDVVVSGGGLIVMIQVDPPVAGSWRAYSVGLRETFVARSPWHKEDGTTPSRSEFEAVLGDLDVVLIRGEHSDTVAGELMGLDNVEL